VAAAPDDARCTALAQLAVPQVTIEIAQPISGAIVAPDGSRVETVPVCRVRGVARPTPGSRIIFELWLPRSGWNGRYYQLGNGGFGGSIHYPSLAWEAARGNAAALSDSGHEGTGFDARWAAGRPDLVADFGHRSIKATSDAARALIAAYYGRQARWRYFAGCSGGGRMALMAAQRSPEEWDGILAGSPANQLTRQLTTFATLQHRLRAVPAAWIPPAKLPAIQRAALAACPPGTTANGFAIDPPRCRFDPRRLACRSAETDRCLTAPQVASLRRIISAGYQPTSTAYPNGWADWVVNANRAGGQIRFAEEAFRFFGRDDPDWRVERFDPRRESIPHGVREAVDADAVDYRPFRAHGGRILSYFGWADAVLSPADALSYYRRVQGRMGGAQDFYRLFMVPGMGHCQGGLAPESFGQSMVSPPLADDPAHDIRRALEAWVERGIPPESLTAVRWEGDRRAGATQRLQPVR
jgi:feruloyl esterase